MMAIEDNESIFNFVCSLMEISDDEEDPNEVTLFGIKNDLDTLHVINFRNFLPRLLTFLTKEPLKI